METYLDHPLHGSTAAFSFDEVARLQAAGWVVREKAAPKKAPEEAAPAKQTEVADPEPDCTPKWPDEAPKTTRSATKRK